LSFPSIVVNGLLPACMTFGPMFLVIEGKTPRHTRILRGLGVGMVMLALMASWLMIESQRGEISFLSQRLDNLERASSPRAAQSALCPP
jgi:hypothetical protein